MWVRGLGNDEHETVELGCGCAYFGFCCAGVSLRPSRDVGAECALAQVSPLLANVYLHYAFDQWAHQWRKRHARGDIVIVRYVDDFVVGFQHHSDAEQFLRDLRVRLARFALDLHPDKTRLIEFGRFAARDRAALGMGKPPTFDFLGFTHVCGTTRDGRFWLRRITMRTRMRAKLRQVKDRLHRSRHLPIPVQGQWLSIVLRGHFAYYAVPGNGQAISTFRYHVSRYWLRALRRRSQRTRMTWERMDRHITRWLPPAHILHPFPDVRFEATTQGRSPVREFRSLGSARGATRKGGPYRYRSITAPVCLIVHMTRPTNQPAQ